MLIMLYSVFTEIVTQIEDNDHEIGFKPHKLQDNAHSLQSFLKGTIPTNLQFYHLTKEYCVFTICWQCNCDFCSCF